MRHLYSQCRAFSAQSQHVPELQNCGKRERKIRPKRDRPKLSFQVNVHGDSEGHRGVGEESEQGVVNGLVKEEVVGEFMACKIQGVADCRSNDVGNSANHPPRLVTNQPSDSELSRHGEDHPVAATRVRTEQVLYLGMLSQDLLSAGPMRLLSVRPGVVLDGRSTHGVVARRAPQA